MGNSEESSGDYIEVSFEIQAPFAAQKHTQVSKVPAIMYVTYHLLLILPRQHLQPFDTKCCCSCEGLARKLDTCMVAYQQGLSRWQDC